MPAHISIGQKGGGRDPSYMQIAAKTANVRQSNIAAAGTSLPRPRSQPAGEQDRETLIRIVKGVYPPIAIETVFRFIFDYRSTSGREMERRKTTVRDI